VRSVQRLLRIGAASWRCPPMVRVWNERVGAVRVICGDMKDRVLIVTPAVIDPESPYGPFLALASLPRPDSLPSTHSGVGGT